MAPMPTSLGAGNLSQKILLYRSRVIKIITKVFLGITDKRMNKLLFGKVGRLIVWG
jgi:hypothetical protein